MATDSLDTFLRIHNILTKAASDKATIAYSDAMSELGWDYKNTYQRNVFAYYLRSIFYLELAAGNPPLTAVVVSKAHGIPQESFFKTAVSEARLRKDETNQQYWAREIARVFLTWSPEPVPTAA